MFKIPPLTSDVLALNFDAPASPTIHLKISQEQGARRSHGWGFGWYPGNQQSVMVVKDPAAKGAEILTSAIADWSNFRSNIFFSKVRGAADGYSQAETQPFSRSFAGRDWLFMHNGDLDKQALERVHGRQIRLLEPLAGTDSELAFCNLLSQMQTHGARQISDLDPNTLHDWFMRFDELGSADMLLSDGQSLVCFQGSQSPKQLCFRRHTPPNRPDALTAEAVDIAFDDPRDAFRTALVVSSSPFSGGDLTPMQPQQLIIANHGVVIWNSAPEPAPRRPVMPAAPAQPHAIERPMALSQNEQAQSQPAIQTPHRILETSPRSITRTPEGSDLTYRLFDLKHETHYQYTEAVEHSTHLFRLQPVVDPIQEVIQSSLTISAPAEDIQFEDVFGNQSVHCTINEPYSTLSVIAKSRVKIYATPPDDHSLSRRQTSIPLIWMPWQRQMMTPYLLPEELPEPQLRELTDYAMGFVERNDFHLLKTINDINLSIYNDYKYVPGSTSLNTTPFEVYATRQGVCQDFANLFICLTRLLSIPSRYRMGYIYTGASYENKIQSDASHAWAEVYLPYVGWRGFDPTNGCMVAQDHIRVACGRNYIDATPTSGTLYKGGGVETLSIDVKMREVTAD